MAAPYLHRLVCCLYVVDESSLGMCIVGIKLVSLYYTETMETKNNLLVCCSYMTLTD